MWLLKVSLIITAVAFSFVTAIPPITHLEKRIGNSEGTCSNGDLVPPVIVGNANGVAFCESNWGTTYTPIVSISVWWEPTWVTGVQVRYADGTTSPVHGRTSTYTGGSININYEAGERFTKVLLYGGEQYFKHLTVKTSDGQELEAGVPLEYGYPGYSEQGVGTGFLVGVYGGANPGYPLNALALIFLAVPVNSIDVSDLDFHNGPEGDENLHPETLAQGHFYNSQSTGNSSWSFQDERALSTTYHFAQASATMFGTKASLTISGFIPGVTFAGGTEFSWAYTYTETKTTDDQETATVHWTESGELSPGTGVECTALVSVGTGTYDYTSQVTLNLANGAHHTYEEKGRITLKDVSDAIVTVKDDNDPPSSEKKKKKKRTSSHN